jgi:hypothetical protein
MIKKQIRKCKHAVAILARSPESDFQHLRMKPFMSELCRIGDVNVGRVSTVCLVIAGFPTCFLRLRIPQASFHAQPFLRACETPVISSDLNQLLCRKALLKLSSGLPNFMEIHSTALELLHANGRTDG